MVTPTGNVDPLVLEAVKEASVQLSLAVGAVQVTTFPQVPAVTLVTILLGIPEMVGRIPSVMVTVKELVAVLPEGSVAV